MRNSRTGEPVRLLRSLPSGTSELGQRYLFAVPENFV